MRRVILGLSVIVLVVAPSAASLVSAGAVVQDPGCENLRPVFPSDGYRLAYLSSPITFGIGSYETVYINQNGNLTFDAPLPDFTPFPLLGTSFPIIAPYFGDVDTPVRNSGTIRYGDITFEGSAAFCVKWNSVSYYSGGNAATTKRNTFQVLLVNRDDIFSEDFDIIFNYDQIQWETGDSSGGEDGVGGFSARVGYSDGAGLSLELPGSGVNGALPDSSPGGLIHGSRNSVVPGRYRFEVRNGVPPAGGGISGTVTDPNGAPVGGALVQVCPKSGDPCPWKGTTDTAGNYTATGLPDGDYNVKAFPPAGSNLVPAEIDPKIGNGSHVTGGNIRFWAADPPPAPVAISPSTPGGGGVPHVYWHDPLTLRATGCPGGTVTFRVLANGRLVYTGVMDETPTTPGSYVAPIPPLYPNHGAALVEIEFTCPNGQTYVWGFTVYIDPSGTVKTADGTPLEGATVTLYYSESGAPGSFVQVPDGAAVPVPDLAAIMSPSNRRNPDTTNALGQYGWDVITGFYIVRAEKTGCTSPQDHSQPFVESGILTIPPAVTGVDLILDCGAPADTTPPTTVAQASPGPNANGWNNTDVTVTLTATDNPGGSGVKEIRYTLSGAQTGGGVVAGNSASVSISTEGATTLTFFARDNAENQEAARTLTIRIDKTPPALACTASPGPNANGWNNTDVTVSFTASDALSGVGTPPGPVTVKSEGANQAITRTATDKAGNSGSATCRVSLDKTLPVISNVPAPITVEQTSLAGAAVAVPLPTVTDNSGPATLTSDAPAVFPVGTTTITFKATDAAGNVATATTTVTVKVVVTPGRMEGAGHIDGNGKRHAFEFHVREGTTGQDRGKLHYWVRNHRPGYDRDGDEDWDDKHWHGHVDRFESTAVTAVFFSDDPAIRPSRHSQPTVDTVEFAGTGRWNREPGYTFRARATDAGEPGRGRDTFSITINAPSGEVVATVTGALSGGNIQSLRVERLESPSARDGRD